MAIPLSDIIYALEPVAWFLATIPLFHYSLRQPPESRGKLLAFHIFLPIQCYRKADRLSLLLPESVWFVALTALCAAVHHVSALMLESWTLSELRKTCPGRNEGAVALKAWMNLRRSPLESHPGRPASHTQRARFLGCKLLEITVSGTLCVIIEALVFIGLQPHSDDFTVQRRGYLHFRLDRQALLRLCLAFHWSWLSIVFSHVIHTTIAIIFVVIFRLDHPDDWPPLFGNPLQAYSLRRFWGVFWHKIAAPSQAVYGRFIFRHLLGFKASTPAEKSFIALWVFTISGIVHSFVNIKANPKANPHLDFHFLLLNFFGGFVESLMINSMPNNMRSGVPLSVKRMVGFAWVYLFFYCTMPSYQWPMYYNEAIRRETAL